jgi:predicted DNA-binding transcriptional regulator AlpA
VTGDENAVALAMVEAALRDHILAEAGGEAEIVAGIVVAKLKESALVPEMGPPSVFVSVGEAAKILGISRSAMDKRIQRHQVPGVVRTAGRRIQIHREKFLAGLARKARR